MKNFDLVYPRSIEEHQSLKGSLPDNEAVVVKATNLKPTLAFAETYKNASPVSHRTPRKSHTASKFRDSTAPIAFRESTFTNEDDNVQNNTDLDNPDVSVFNLPPNSHRV